MSAVTSPSCTNRNTCWVIPGRLPAGEYPGAEDPCAARETLNRFLACGIGGFLDLTAEGEAAPYRFLLERLALRQGFDVAYRRYSIPARSVSNVPSEMDRMPRQIDEWLNAGRCVYVHGRGGVGRYLVRTGLSGDQALQRLQQLRAFVSEVKQSCFPRSPQTAEQYIRGWPCG